MGWRVLHYSFLKPSPNAAAKAHLAGKWLLSRPEREVADRGVLAVGGRRISRRANHGMAGHGMLDLLHRTVVVLNDSDGHADKRTRTILAQQFANQGQVVIEVPFDLHLRPGA